MIKIAVLGCGRIGRVHAANIDALPSAELAAVYDIHTPSAVEVATTYGVPVADNADEIFSASDIDAVLLATATDTHANYIEQALASGKAIFCEKPIDLSLERVNRCAAIVEGSKLPIQLGFNRRFDPGHRAARDALRNGDIGELQQLIITSRDPSMPPKAYLEAAGGLLRDMTIHDFDLARFMLGEEPVEIFAMANALIDPALGAELGDVDTAMIILRTASGKQCYINNSRNAVYGYDQRIELLGASGMILSDNRKPHETRRYSAAETEASSPYQFFFVERYREAFMAELAAFVDCIAKGVQPEVGFDDGRKALLLAEAAYKSMAEQRTVRTSEFEL